MEGRQLFIMKKERRISQLGEANIEHSVASFSTAGLTCEDFLSTVRGAPYAIMFRGLRIQHLVNDLASVKILEQDHIIPMGE